MATTAAPARDTLSSPTPFQALDDLVHARLSESSMGLSPIALALAQADWALHLAASPGRQMQLASRALELWQGLAARVWQQALAAPAADAAVPAPPEADPRFADAGWQHWPFSFWKDSFKATETWWREASQVEGMNRHHRHMVEFFARQGVDALSPSNSAWTHPSALQAAWDTGGQAWLNGAQQWLRDSLEDAAQGQAADDATGSPGLPPLPYAVGQDVAITPGKVVFRNHLFELIRYAPSTARVQAEPLLIVPSCIMKYYILDLSPGNSMVRWLVGQGFTVLIMSWRNPDASDRHLGMQDYLQQGVMQALAAAKASTGAARVHALGYCLGGTFLAIVAALLARLRRQRADALSRNPNPPARRSSDLDLDALPELATVTLLAAQTDFSEPGELGVFIDDDQLRTLRESMARTGFFSGRAMAASFQFLNSRDLVWSRNLRRYVLGQREVGNDMMSWNADVTRLPERMHGEYLSSLFLNNALAAGQYRVAGEPVALKDIDMPLMVVGTVRDHVSPWRSVYRIHLLTDTDTTFVLASGGHNAGIVSEPGHAHRSWQMGHVARGHGWTDPDTWLAQTPQQPGSWWTALADWLKQHASGEVPAARIPARQALADAPGSYVHVRYRD